MSDSTRKFCQNCGLELPTGASFCPRCGTTTAGGAPQQPSTYYRRRDHRHEKYEKQEKHEKNEKGEKGGRGGNVIGPIVGGLILIWLGITFYLQQAGTISSDHWWAYFVAGIGVIIILQGFLLYARNGHAVFGPFIGGAVLVFVGLSFAYNAWSNFWPFIIVIIGVAILGSALARSRTPSPT